MSGSWFDLLQHLVCPTYHNKYKEKSHAKIFVQMVILSIDQWEVWYSLEWPCHSIAHLYVYNISSFFEFPSVEIFSHAILWNNMFLPRSLKVTIWFKSRPTKGKSNLNIFSGWHNATIPKLRTMLEVDWSYLDYIVWAEYVQCLFI